jgi:catechol 2,3-dioxygenase-like lactoylglutathione lyase family enzyme
MPVPSPSALHHTCFVVRDVVQTARTLAASLGIGPWNVWTLEPAEFKVHDQAAASSFRLALATIGGGTYELVSPHTGVSVYNEHLDTYGQSFHHTCLLYPTHAAFEAVRAEMIRQGRTVIQEGGTPGVFAFAYFAFPEIGSAIEALWLDLSKMPPPETVI